MKAVHACVVVAVAVMLYGGIGHSAPAPEARDGELRSEASAGIDAFVAERMAVRGIPGVAIAVVRDGETVHLAGYGRADATGRAVTPDTPFLFGSVSKVFTAAALLQLIEEGALSLDEPVLPYLAAITGQPPAGYAGITIEHLLTHTCGLPMSLGLAGTERIHPGPDALDRRVGPHRAGTERCTGRTVRVQQRELHPAGGRHRAGHRPGLRRPPARPRLRSARHGPDLRVRPRARGRRSRDGPPVVVRATR